LPQFSQRRPLPNASEVVLPIQLTHGGRGRAEEHEVAGDLAGVGDGDGSRPRLPSQLIQRHPLDLQPLQRFLEWSAYRLKEVEALDQEPQPAGDGATEGAV